MVRSSGTAAPNTSIPETDSIAVSLSFPSTGGGDDPPACASTSSFVNTENSRGPRSSSNSTPGTNPRRCEANSALFRNPRLRAAARFAYDVRRLPEASENSSPLAIGTAMPNSTDSSPLCITSMSYEGAISRLPSAKSCFCSWLLNSNVAVVIGKRAPIVMWLLMS